VRTKINKGGCFCYNEIVVKGAGRNAPRGAQKLKFILFLEPHAECGVC
jgi:hypothetical protein